MSIFSTIRDFLFGKKEEPQAIKNSRFTTEHISKINAMYNPSRVTYVHDARTKSRAKRNVTPEVAALTNREPIDDFTAFAVASVVSDVLSSSYSDNSSSYDSSYSSGCDSSSYDSGSSDSGSCGGSSD